MYDLWDTACKRNGFIKYDLVPSVEQSLCFQIEYKIFWEPACKRNGFIEYGFLPSAEQSLCWLIEYKIFFYYLLGMICGTLHAKEKVSLNMASFLVWNNLCAGKLSGRSFFIIYYV